MEKERIAVNRSIARPKRFDVESAITADALVRIAGATKPLGRPKKLFEIASMGIATRFHGR